MGALVVLGRPVAAGSDLVALGPLAHQLAVATDRLGLLAGATLGRLLIVPPHAHLAIQPFTLHLLLERAQRLIDIIVANLNLDDDRSPENATASAPDQDAGTTKGVPSTEGWQVV